MNKNRQLKPLCAAILVASAPVTSIHALPPGAAVDTSIAGDATYTLENANEATLSASQNSIVRIDDSAFTGDLVGVGETLSLSSSGGEIITIMADIVGSSNLTRVSGDITGDGMVNLILRDADGVVLSGATITNVPALVGTSHSFDADLNAAEFIGFADGLNPLELTATGKTVVVDDVQLVDSKLVLVSSIVDLQGDTVSNGEIHIAIGETVELGIPGSGLLSVDITAALDTSCGTAGCLRTGFGSSVQADKIDWNVAVNDPASFAVNSFGAVRATGASIGEDGVINIVGKGGRIFLGGETDAGNSEVTITGDDIILASNVTASQLTVELGAAAASVDAADGKLDTGTPPLFALQFENPNIVINGAGGQNHTVEGFVDYNVVGQNTSTASMLLPNGEVVPGSEGSIQINNVGTLVAANVEYNNTIVVNSGASIDSISTDPGDDTFLIEGTVGDLFSGADQDTIIMSGGNVTGTIDAGGGEDTLQNVFLLDDNGNPTTEFLGQTSSQFVAGWTNVENVIAASLPPVSSNLLADTNSFDDLNGLGVTSLNLTGDELVAAPCGIAQDLNPETNDVPCVDKPDYLAMLKTTIYFDNDSSQILAPAAAKLDRVSEFVLDYGHFNEVSVSGHTDANASNAYNLKLSERRANSTVRYMTEKGVDAELFKTYFYGEELPAVPNDTPENLAKNRRAVVELKR